MYAGLYREKGGATRHTHSMDKNESEPKAKNIEPQITHVKVLEVTFLRIEHHYDDYRGGVWT